MKFYKSTDLDIGTYYHVSSKKDPRWFFVIRNAGPNKSYRSVDYTRINGYGISNFNCLSATEYQFGHYNGASIEDRNVREATYSEIQWLDDCIANKGLVPYTERDELTCLSLNLRKEISNASKDN